jgi:hypothetical protein
LQKNHESTKEHNSKSQKLKFVMIFVSTCQYKFSNIGSTAVKCRKQTQVMSTSWFGLSSSDYNKKWTVFSFVLLSLLTADKKI